MPDGDPRDFVCLRTCLVFWEAVTWIARRDFSIPANRIGPRQLNILPVWGDEEDEDDNGRYELAHELLMDRAAKGKIRLYARGGSSELVDEKSISFPMELSPEFIKKAEYVFEDELQLAELEPQKLRVPPGTGNRQLVVGQDVGALLRLGPPRGDHHGDFGDAELPGSEHPGVARNQAAVLAHQP